MQESMLRVLYLHPASAFGGASKSLIELYAILRTKDVSGVVLTPRGSAGDACRAAGFDVRNTRGLSQFDNTRYGYYRKQRWLIVLRELVLLPFSLFALWRLRHESFDLIHVNEVTLLPLGILAKYFLRVPLIVHVRSLQRKPQDGIRSRWVNVLLRRHADAVVPIDHTVAATLAEDLPLTVVHNGLKVSKSTEPVRSGENQVVQVGFLGVLIPLKGIFELLEAMRILKARGVRIRCLVAGENARQLSGIKAWVLGKLGFARDVMAELEAFIHKEGLEEAVQLLGFISDVRQIYPQLDILCFPSFLDAAGRPVFEAAFYAIPSIVAVQNPMPDAILHEVTGLAIPLPDPVLIADALQKLVDDPASRRRMGQQAQVWAEKTFSIEANAERMLDLYRHVLSRSAKR